MAKLPAIQFYPGDWRKDLAVQSLDYHDRGVWFEILCLMHESGERGKLLLNGKKIPEAALARLLGLDKQILTSTLTTLITSGVAKVEQETGVIYCKRMVDDENLRQIRSEAGKQGGNPVLLKQNPTTPVKQNPTPSSSSSSSTTKNKKEELREETATPPAPEKPIDMRKVHPAIVGVWKVTGRYPTKDVWDELIEKMGADDIDEVKLADCFRKWRVRGFKPTNFAWATEWYIDGIPDLRKNTNGKSTTNFREQRKQEAINDHNVITNLRQRVAERSVQRRDDVDSSRQLLGVGTGSDNGGEG